MTEFVFYTIAVSLCVFAVLAVTVGDVFHGALWLTFTLLSVAGIYFFLGAPFLGVIQVMVYVGGIMTLFIFAIKLTANIGDTSIRQLTRQFWPGAVLSGAVLVLMRAAINVNAWSVMRLPSEQGPDLKVLGAELLTKYMLPFEFISLLLLAALVGAIVIGKVKK